MEALFEPAASGARLLVHHPPTGERTVGVVLAPAFAEEMNKSRHIVAQAARRLAAGGIGVLLIDLFGCGDSTGRFDEATWSAWRDDVALGLRWLQERGYRRQWVWGHRIGALLAAEAASMPASGVERCVLWQPVVRGDAYLNQFLRLRTTAALLAMPGKGAGEGESVKQLRAQLASGESVEVAGYRLAPALAAALDQLDLGALTPRCPVHWYEVVPEEGRSLTAAGKQALALWQSAGVPVTVRPIVGEPFWTASSTIELVQCPTLVDSLAADASTWI